MILVIRKEIAPAYCTVHICVLPLKLY